MRQKDHGMSCETNEKHLVHFHATIHKRLAVLESKFSFQSHLELNVQCQMIDCNHH